MVDIPNLINYDVSNSELVPPSIPSWTIDPTRTVLLVHDMQKYFLRFFSDPTQETVLAQSEKMLRWATDNGAQIAYSAQPGGMTPAERGLLSDVWGPGMSKEPGNVAITNRLRPRDGDWMVTKWRYSAFARTRLLPMMKQDRRDQLIILGVYAHVGVLTTAIEAFSEDIQTFLVSDAIGDFSYRSHRDAMRYAASRCAVVTSADRVLSEV